MLVVKRFVHTLGFAFLPLHATLYVWDQIFMKVMKNRLEIYVVMCVMLICLRDSLLQCAEWDDMVDVVYKQGKKIKDEFFIQQYVQVFKDQRFYLSPYNVNPEIVNRDRGVDGTLINPLQELLEEQQRKHKQQYNNKWREGGGNQQDDDDAVNYQQDPYAANLQASQTELNNISLNDVMKSNERFTAALPRERPAIHR